MSNENSRDLFARQYDEVAPYYDEVMAVVPYTQWVKYLQRLCRRYGWQPRDVLDLACGTGTVSLLLAEAGFRVTGVDLSEGMLQVARRKAATGGVGDIAFLHHDATRLPFVEKFDLVVSLFDSLNYILTSKGLQDAFAGAYRGLRPGGGFIFDLNSEYSLVNNLFTQDNLWDEQAGLKYDWKAGYNDRTRMATIDMRFYLPDGRAFQEIHKERAHRHADVISFLERTGFEVLDAFDAYSFLPCGSRSERIFYIARKP
ncbi:MAG: class I SAM-dependent DNA methyltransferase [Armatimonadota bacterium]